MAGTPASGKTLFIIDYYAQLFRAYHAIRSSMTSPVTQEPTNATFGYVGMLLKVLREYKPDYLIVATDKSGDHGTFRSEIYPEYKANREPPPLDFRPQAQRCLAITEMLGIPVIGVERFEADDVIASLVTRLTSEHPDLEIRIISKDKDLEQLLSQRVALLDVHKDESITVESLMEKKGIRPDQVIDLLSLMGDTIDNVPGVRGIGPKTAAQLIQQYGSIDNLLTHLDDIKGKRKENIEAARDMLPLSRTLVTLRHDVDCDIDLHLAQVDPQQIPLNQVLEVFRTLGFNRHQDDLKALVTGGGEASSDTPSATAEQQRSPEPARNEDDLPADGLFAAIVSTGPQSIDDLQVETKRGNYECIRTLQQLEALIAECRKAKIVSIDTETTDIAPISADLCGISIALEAGTGAYIPIRSPSPDEHLNERQVLDAMRDMLEDEHIAKVGHNIKYDWIVFRRAGVALKGVAADTMIASYLTDSSRTSHSMDALAQAVLNYHCIPISQLIGERGRSREQKRFSQVALELASEYAAEDADVTLRLWQVFEPQIRAMGLRTLFDDVEMPLVEVLASMEYAGMRVDPDVLDEQRAKIVMRLNELRQGIVDYSPHAFNPDSPRQLAAALFNSPDGDPPGLGLKVVKKNKSGPSTDIEVLEKLAADPTVKTPVPTLIVEYRQLTKLVNTYLIALKESINPRTGRIHASFHQTVAATGRLSSSDPNLQNIPVRTEVGRQIRAAFVAKDGCQLITADYSQIELRLLAHLSDDEGLIDAFRHDADIHTAVAAIVFNTDPAKVTREQRNSAKMVNFGIIYGITAFGLARRLGEGTSNEQAARIIADYKARYPGIDRFLNECVETARRKGYVETMLKRRRAVPQVKSRNPMEKSLGERMAINSVVQGSAADLIKIAMINLYRKLPARFAGTNMLLQIHDELVFEVPEKDVEAVKQFVVSEMESAMTLKVPLKVEAGVAKNWLEGK